MRNMQEFLATLAADNAAMVRLLDGSTLAPVEDLRVLVVDRHNFTPSLASTLQQSGVRVLPSDDGARSLFLLLREDARRLLAHVNPEAPLPALFIERAGEQLRAGEVRALVFLGSRALSCDAPLSKVRRAASTSPAHLAVLRAMHSARR